MNRIPALLLMLLLLAACQSSPADDHREIRPEAVPSTQTQADSTYLPTGFYYLAANGQGIRMQEAVTNTIHSLQPVPFAGVEHIANTWIEKNQDPQGDNYSICLQFDKQGTADLKQGTGNPDQPKIAVVLAGKLQYVVDNRQQISTGRMCVIFDKLSLQEVEAIKKQVDQKR